MSSLQLHYPTRQLTFKFIFKVDYKNKSKTPFAIIKNIIEYLEYQYLTKASPFRQRKCTFSLRLWDLCLHLSIHMYTFSPSYKFRHISTLKTSNHPLELLWNMKCLYEYSWRRTYLVCLFVCKSTLSGHVMVLQMFLPAGHHISILCFVSLLR